MDEAAQHHPADRGIGTLSIGDLAALWGILVLALVLRTVGIGWGLPPATPEVAASGIRSSYALDEDDVLDHVARTNPAALDFDPSLYKWGTSHLGLTLVALEIAQKLGFFDSQWRESFREMRPGGFERTYIVGRLVSALADLATVFLVFLVGREIAGPAMGLWSSAIIAVAPGHVLLASQIRVDLTAAALVMLATLFGIRLAKAESTRLAPLMGLAAGLSISAKYSAAPMALAVCATSLWPLRRNGRAWLIAAAAALCGLLIGEPFLLTNTCEVLRQVGGLIAISPATPPEFRLTAPALLAAHLMHLPRFSAGIPAALLGAWGLFKLSRADPRTGIIFAAAILAGIAVLFPQKWPLMRSHLPLVPFIALAAGYTLSRLPRAFGWPLGLLALAVGVAASLAQIHFMLSPHPVNLALSVLQNSAAPGDAVSRIMPEIPPLNERVYPHGPNPLTGRLAANPPEWVVTTDLPMVEYPPANREFLKDRYETIAIFRSKRILAWATLGESVSPHDWKYTHPATTLYRLRR